MKMKMTMTVPRYFATSATAVLFAASVSSAQDLTPAPAASAQIAPVNTSKSSLWNNLSVFAGLDGSKQPQDLGINANMGVRFSVNAGFPLPSLGGIGIQAGAAVNMSDAAVHVLDQIEGTSRRTQTFATIGLFQNAHKMNWGLVYDHLEQSYYDRFSLGQIRGTAGYMVTGSDEIGGWFVKGVLGADGVMGDTPVRLDPISQLNAYLTHTWPTFARTSLWAGVANGHHNIVWVLPDNSRDSQVFVYGAEVDVPLSDRFALAGSANFLTPTATGTVDAFLGLTFFPGRNAHARNRGAFVPRQAVANNPSFATNMSR
jgi:hypothetical protein